LNADAGDLTAAAADAISTSRLTSAAVMDLKHRPNVADQTRTSATTRTEIPEVSSGGTDRSEATKDDVIATKEVEVCTVAI